MHKPSPTFYFICVGLVCSRMGQRTRVQLPAIWKPEDGRAHSWPCPAPWPGLHQLQRINRGKTQAEDVFRKTYLPFPVPT